MVVYKQDSKVLGYLFSINLDYAKKLNFFNEFFKNLESLEYNCKNINEFNYCVLGQLCIKKEFRGKGILEKLHSKIKEELINRKYDIAVSEIAENNMRSIGANLGRMGMKGIGNYTSNDVEWLIVVLDL